MNIAPLSADGQMALNELMNKPELFGCISYVQRRMGWSYGQAAIAVEELESAGLLSVAGDLTKRHWLIDVTSMPAHPEPDAEYRGRIEGALSSNFPEYPPDHIAFVTVRVAIGEGLDRLGRLHNVERRGIR